MRVLVYGAGQLAQMMQLAAFPMGITVQAVDVATRSVVDALTKQPVDISLEDAIAQATVLTAEFEHVPEDLLAQADASGKLQPNQAAILIGADRVREKQLLTELKFRTVNMPLLMTSTNCPQSLRLWVKS